MISFDIISANDGRDMPYRLEIDARDPSHPYIVEDTDGKDKLIVLFELLRFHTVMGNDHNRAAERVIDEIDIEAKSIQL